MLVLDIAQECKLCGKMFQLNEDGWCQSCEDHVLEEELEYMEEELS